jgi:hypothetical protein
MVDHPAIDIIFSLPIIVTYYLLPNENSDVGFGP